MDGIKSSQRINGPAGWRGFLAGAALLALALVFVRPDVLIAATATGDGPAAFPPGIELDGGAVPGYPAPISSAMLFNSGAPATNPYGTCGSCYAWSSTYYSSPTNFDLTARRFTVPAGSFATSIRAWWVYGSEGPFASSANHGGTAGDFSAVYVDIYDASGPGGSPGALLATLAGTWSVLDAPSHYREILLSTPFLFTGTNYYASLRAVTASTNYDATVLWLMCAPHDGLVDYENYLTSGPSTSGWQSYSILSPCPADQDFGLQVLGHLASNSVDLTAEPNCITPAHPCNTIAVDFNRVPGLAVRGYSVTLALSPNLQLCSSVAGSILQGSFLSDYPSGITHFEAVDNLDGTFTVDCALLGADCGPTGSGTLFTVAVKRNGSDGVGTVTVTSVTMRDCDNGPVAASPGSPVAISIDTVAPVAIAGLAAVQKKTGNDGDGTTKVQVNFTAPLDAAAVAVYRAGFGNYPEYDDAPGAGSVPSMPGAYPPGPPWSLTGVAGDGQYDEVASPRNVWYYVVYSQDPCGNWSPVSNMAGGVLNYHLGDVAPALSGDNQVDILDVSLLGAHYGITLVVSDPFNYLDVGPTTTFSVDGRPTTDNRVNFEDLMMFAINYNVVSDGTTPPAHGEHPALVLTSPRTLPAPGQTFTARLDLRGNQASTKGIHAQVAFDHAQLELVSIDQGTWLRSQGSNVFFRSVDEQQLGWTLDAASLGTGLTFRGSGDVALLTFRVIAPAGAPRLAGSELRDRDNRALGGVAVASAPERPVESASLPTRVDLLGARPDPFHDATRIAFRLPASMNVELSLFDVSGRLVATLHDGVLPAGDHDIRWNGTDDHGQLVAQGVYFYAFHAGDTREIRKLLRQR